jgi:hypothetical protein
MKSRAWPWPLALALLTGVGLFSALCGDGVCDALSWTALGLVLTLSVRHTRRR